MKKRTEWLGAFLAAGVVFYFSHHKSTKAVENSGTKANLQSSYASTDDASVMFDPTSTQGPSKTLKLHFIWSDQYTANQEMPLLSLSVYLNIFRILAEDNPGRWGSSKFVCERQIQMIPEDWSTLKRQRASAETCSGTAAAICENQYSEDISKVQSLCDEFEDDLYAADRIMLATWRTLDTTPRYDVSGLEGTWALTDCNDPAYQIHDRKIRSFTTPSLKSIVPDDDKSYPLGFYFRDPNHILTKYTDGVGLDSFFEYDKRLNSLSFMGNRHGDGGTLVPGYKTGNAFRKCITTVSSK